MCLQRCSIYNSGLEHVFISREKFSPALQSDRTGKFQFRRRCPYQFSGPHTAGPTQRGQQRHASVVRSSDVTSTFSAISYLYLSNLWDYTPELPAVAQKKIYNFNVFHSSEKFPPDVTICLCLTPCDCGFEIQYLGSLTKNVSLVKTPLLLFP